MPHLFQIEIKLGYQTKRFSVTYLPVNDRVEHFRIHGRNKAIVLESNRPLFRKKGIRHRKPNYKLVQGTVDHLSSLEPFIAAIDRYFESRVSVTFDQQGRTLHGILSRVSGAGKAGGMYHLQVDNFHWGELYSTDSGWKWGSNSVPELAQYVEYFGRQVGTLPG